jgi:hypothetical protein
MSESTQKLRDQTDEVDENAQKPGEEDTDTVAGFPKEAPESKDDESKQDE